MSKNFLAKAWSVNYSYKQVEKASLEKKLRFMKLEFNIKLLSRKWYLRKAE